MKLKGHPELLHNQKASPSCFFAGLMLALYSYCRGLWKLKEVEQVKNRIKLIQSNVVFLQEIHLVYNEDLKIKRRWRESVFSAPFHSQTKKRFHLVPWIRNKKVWKVHNQTEKACWGTKCLGKHQLLTIQLFPNPVPIQSHERNELNRYTEGRKS